MVVDLRANNRNFNANMRGAQSTVSTFAKSVGTAAAGVLSATAVMGAFSQTVESVRAQFERLDKVAKDAAKLGALPERLMELQFAFEQTGVDVRQGTTGLQRMTRRISEAAMGSGAAVKALEELGLEARQLNQLPIDQQFREIARAMQFVENQSDRVRLAMKLFDSEGVALVNTMRDLEAVLQDARDLGIGFSAEDLAKIERANDSMNRLRHLSQQMAGEIATFVAPAVERAFDVIVDRLKDAENGWETFVELIKTPVQLPIDFFTRDLSEMREELNRAALAYKNLNDRALALAQTFRTEQAAAAKEAAEAAKQQEAATRALEKAQREAAEAIRRATQEQERRDEEIRRKIEDRKRRQEQFNQTIKEMNRSLKERLGLISAGNAAFDRAREAGATAEQANRIRELTEAEEKLNRIRGLTGASQRDAGAAERGSAQAAKIVAESNRGDAIKRIQKEQLEVLKELLAEEKDKNKLTVEVGGPV